jgi:hypothetical protein
MRRNVLGSFGGLLMALSAATSASAGEPDPGHQDLYPHQPGDARRTLDFHFNSLQYPAWFRSTAESTLEVSWDSIAANNSNVPRYSNGGNNVGGGTIFYVSQGTSPCTGDPEWLACNPAGGRTEFAIYVRTIPSITKPTWLWWNRDSTCNDVYPGDGFPTSMCFSTRRVIAHESTHNTLTRLHNTNADDESIMQARTPTPNGSPDNWNRPNFLPCDEAAAQLEYGLADPSDDYADCFATTPGDGAKGLNTRLTITSGTSYTKCVDGTVSVRGRLALNDVAAYEDMRNTPLSGRVVRIDRKARNATSWSNGVNTAVASGASGDNWSATITSSIVGPYDYRARWFTSAGEPALNSSNEIAWSITWTTTRCPLLVQP